MSGTMMENKPLSPSSAEPESGPGGVTPKPSPEHSFAESPVEAPREFSLRRIFRGPEGISALPRWLLYLAMAWVVFEAEAWLAASLQDQLNYFRWRMLIEARLAIAAILPAFAMARIEGRPFGEFGLPWRRAFGRNFWMGALWGIGSLSVLMLALGVCGAYRFGALSLHGPRLWKFAAYYAVLFLLTGFFEDFLMRGYSQWVLARSVNFWPAAVLLSTAFGFIHGANPGEAKAGLVAAGLIGFFFCLTLRRTGDLWWAVGFHMAWDWGESYFYSVPDSGVLLPGHLLNSYFYGPVWLTGGSVGPEGSYLIFVLIGGLWIAFDRTYREVKYKVS